MSYQIIQNLLEELSLEFVLADSAEPESLSVILPILTEIGDHARTLGVGSFSERLEYIHNLVNETINANDSDAENNFKDLESAISEIKVLIRDLGRSGETGNTGSDNTPVKAAKSDSTSDNVPVLIIGKLF